jgi:hypothetical protein
MNLNEIKRDIDWVAFAIEHKAQTMDLVARAGDAADMAMKTALSGLPRFRQEGNFNAAICYVGAEPAPWGDGSEIVLCMYLWDGEIQQGDWWRGSLATSYATGNNAGKTRLQLTIDALKRIGFDAEQTGSLDGALALVGQEIPIWVKSSVKGDKTYYNIGAIGSSFEVKPSISLRTLRLGQPAAPAFQPAPVAPAAPQWQQPAAPAPTPFQQSAPQNPAAQKFGGRPAAPAAPAAPPAPPSPFGPWNGGNGNGLA